MTRGTLVFVFACIDVVGGAGLAVAGVGGGEAFFLSFYFNLNAADEMGRCKAVFGGG